MNKGQLVTRYIKHLADSADFKVGTSNKHCNGLTGNRVEMPNVSYTHPLYFIFYISGLTTNVLSFLRILCF
jgi:hypothetical protein